MSRVFITGMGVSTPVGSTCAEFWQSLTNGRSGIGRIETIDVSDLATQIGGEVRDIDFDSLTFDDRISPRKLDKASLFALHAVREALTQAGLPEYGLGERVGVVIGSGLSGLQTLCDQTERLIRKGPRAVSVFTIPMIMPNAPVANVSLAFGTTGPSYNVGSACASSGHALIDAYELLQKGMLDCVIAGGAEASLTRLGMAAFINMKAMTKSHGDQPEKAIRPFDLDRNGFVMSEGAGMLVLETEESMLRRGATPLAEFVGYGSTSDASHIVRPADDGAGAISAIQQAVAMAGETPAEVAASTYVNAHGTGTELNDKVETLALKSVFGSAADKLLVSSTKSMTGHLIGASAAVETIACVHALRNRIVPPTINLDTPDPDCDLDYVPHVAREADVRFAVCNTFGFGGHNVSLTFRAVDA